MRLLSLFSGCGGMDIGFEGGFRVFKECLNLKINKSWISKDFGDTVLLKRNNFTTVFANDIRPSAKAAWVSYFSRLRSNAEKDYHVMSVVDLVKNAKLGEKVFPNDIDVVTGGFPCQDFSVAGKRKGFESDMGHDGHHRSADVPTEESRGKLYMWMREVVTLTLPKMFIAENVKGLVSLENVKSIIESDFAEAGGGYIVVPAKVLHAADYGVPQTRERVIFFGFRKSELTKEASQALTQSVIPAKYDPYPQPTHNCTVNEPKLKSPTSCAAVLRNLAEPDQSDDPSQQNYSKAKWYGTHCQGQKELDWDKPAPTIRSEHHGNIEFRRLSKEHGGKMTTELEQGCNERRLSVRECARIQTFPDEFQFLRPGERSASEAYKLIGNAVPCLLAYHIARRLGKNWDLYFGKKGNK